MTCNGLDLFYYVTSILLIKQINPISFIVNLCLYRCLCFKTYFFFSQVKWGDTHDGYGEHFFDYNHGPKHDYKHEPVHHPVYKSEPGPHLPA